MNLCEKKTAFKKAGISLNLGFVPTQKSCLEAFENKPCMTEKMSLKLHVLFCDVENVNEAMSLSNNIPDSMKQVMSYRQLCHLPTPEWSSRALHVARTVVSYINAHLSDEVLLEVIKVIFKISKYFLAKKVMLIFQTG